MLSLLLDDIVSNLNIREFYLIFSGFMDLCFNSGRAGSSQFFNEFMYIYFNGLILLSLLNAIDICTFSYLVNDDTVQQKFFRQRFHHCL